MGWIRLITPIALMITGVFCGEQCGNWTEDGGSFNGKFIVIFKKLHSASQSPQACSAKCASHEGCRYWLHHKAKGCKFYGPDAKKKTGRKGYMIGIKPCSIPDNTQGIDICPSSVIWDDNSRSCETHCLEEGYIAGQLADSPRRCRCRKYEETCGENSVFSSVFSWIYEGKQICYYDICNLGMTDSATTITPEITSTITSFTSTITNAVTSTTSITATSPPVTTTAMTSIISATAAVTSTTTSAITSTSTTFAPASFLPKKGSWNLIFRQTINDVDELFKKNEWFRNENNEDAPNFSLLGDFQNFRKPDGTFHLFLWYPELGKGNEWLQTSNPVTKTSKGVDNYQPVSISYIGRWWGGLEHHNRGKALLDGSIHKNEILWWYAVGATELYESGIPGPWEFPKDDGYIVKTVELYVDLGREIKSNGSDEGSTTTHTFATQEGPQVALGERAWVNAQGEISHLKEVDVTDKVEPFIEPCVSLCLETENCVGFTYVIQKQICQLKAAKDAIKIEKFPGQDTLAAKIHFDYGSCGDFIDKGVEFYNDKGRLATFSDIYSVGECANECGDEEGCINWTSSPAEGKCELFGSDDRPKLITKRYDDIPGSTSGQKPCNQPLDCLVAQWSDWSICSRSCGNGEKRRNRNPTQLPSSFGAKCPLLTEIEQCNTQLCKDLAPETPTNIPRPTIAPSDSSACHLSDGQVSSYECKLEAAKESFLIKALANDTHALTSSETVAMEAVDVKLPWKYENFFIETHETIKRIIEKNAATCQLSNGICDAKQRKYQAEVSLILNDFVAIKKKILGYLKKNEVTRKPAGCPVPNVGAVKVGGNVRDGCASCQSRGPEDCADKCDNHPDCAAWTLNTNNNLCWLKTKGYTVNDYSDWLWGLPCKEGQHLRQKRQMKSASKLNKNKQKARGFNFQEAQALLESFEEYQGRERPACGPTDEKEMKQLRKYFEDIKKRLDADEKKDQPTEDDLFRKCEVFWGYELVDELENVESIALVSASSVRECQKPCEDNPACMAWTFDKQTGVCHLKDAKMSEKIGSTWRWNLHSSRLESCAVEVDLCHPYRRANQDDEDAMNYFTKQAAKFGIKEEKCAKKIQNVDATEECKNDEEDEEDEEDIEFWKPVALICNEMLAKVINEHLQSPVEEFEKPEVLDKKLNDFTDEEFNAAKIEMKIQAKNDTVRYLKASSGTQPRARTPRMLTEFKQLQNLTRAQSLTQLKDVLSVGDKLQAYSSGLSSLTEMIGLDLGSLDVSSLSSVIQGLGKGLNLGGSGSNSLGDSGNSLFSTVGNLASSFGGSGSNPLEDSGSFLSITVGNLISSSSNSLGNVANSANGLGDAVNSGLNNLISSGSNSLGNVANSANGLGDTVNSGLNNLISSGSNSLGNVANSANSGLNNLISSGSNSLGNVANSANGLGDAVNSGLNNVGNLGASGQDLGNSLLGSLDSFTSLGVDQRKTFLQNLKQKIENEKNTIIQKVKEKIEASLSFRPTEKEALSKFLDKPGSMRAEINAEARQFFNEKTTEVTWKRKLKNLAKRQVSAVAKGLNDQAGGIIATNQNGLSALFNIANSNREKEVEEEDGATAPTDNKNQKLPSSGTKHPVNNDKSSTSQNVIDKQPTEDSDKKDENDDDNDEEGQKGGKTRRRGEKLAGSLTGLQDSVGTATGAIDAFSSGDPMSMISASLDVIGAVTQFLPPPADAIGSAVVGLINGVMSLLGGPAAPSEMEILGDKIEQQTEILKGAIEEQTTILLDRFERLEKANVHLMKHISKEVENSNFLNLIDNIQGALQLLKVKQEHLTAYRTSCIDDWSEIALEADTQVLTRLLGTVSSFTYRFCSSDANLAFCGKLIFQYTLLSILKHRVNAEVIAIVRKSEFKNSHYKIKGLLAAYQTTKNADKAILENILFTPGNATCLITCAFHGGQKYANKYVNEFDLYNSTDIGMSENEKKVVLKYARKLGIPADGLDKKISIDRDGRQKGPEEFCQICYADMPCSGNAKPGPGEEGVARGGKPSADNSGYFCQKWQEPKEPEPAKLCATVSDYYQNNEYTINIESGEEENKHATPDNNGISHIEVARGCQITVWSQRHFQGKQKTYNRLTVAAPYYLGNAFNGLGKGWSYYVYSFKCVCDG